MKIVRTTSENKDFVMLVEKLDAYLKITDGDEHHFYNQYNSISTLQYVVICYVDKKPVGCGVFKKYNEKSVEIKRMYVLPEKRGLGIASRILSALEFWAKNEGYKKTVLETGKRQVAAVEFYLKCGYQKTANYGQYIGIQNSVCFEKIN